MKKTFVAILAILIVVLCVSCNKKEEQAKVVRVYSILHEEETEALARLFTEKTGIKVEYLRATTGELVNRVIAEKSNPNADIILGGAASYHIQMESEGALEKYESKMTETLPSYARSENGTWKGFCVLTLGIGINADRYKEKFADIPVPSTWEDLLNPAYKGEIVVTNPVASSTAYLFVQNQLQRLGEEEGWKYLEKLSSLVGQFPDSGSAPAKLVGTGEYTLGVSYIHAVLKYKAEGFNVEVIAPNQSVGDVDCVSIIKGTKNLNEAQAFVDFILSKEAQEYMSSIDFTVPVNLEAKGAAGSISVAELDLINYDSAKAAEEKDRVLEKWTQIVR